MTSPDYCNRCGMPHGDGECGRDSIDNGVAEVLAAVADNPEAFPLMTVAEKLDAAQTGDEFGAVIMGLFGSLENAMRTPSDDDLHTDE